MVFALFHFQKQFLSNLDSSEFTLIVAPVYYYYGIRTVHYNYGTINSRTTFRLNI